MSTITVNSKPGEFPGITLMPGNTLAITLDGTDAIITVNVPLFGFPWCEVFSRTNGIEEHFAFITKRTQQKIKQIAEKEGQL